MRVFCCSPDSQIVEALTEALHPLGYDAVGHTDPRQIREVLALGRLDAVLLHERFTSPPAPGLAKALAQFLPHPCALLLVTDEVVSHDETGPFHATVKWPVLPRVLADRLRRAVALSHQQPIQPDGLLLAELELRGLRGGDQTLYGVLDLRPGASSDAITKAYDRLSLLFHPDRIRTLHDEALQQQASDIYAQVVDAYRVLRVPVERARYDRSLQSAGTLPMPRAGGVIGARATASLPLEELSTIPAARKALRLAAQAMASKDVGVALTQVRFAVTMDPDNLVLAQRLIALEQQAGRS